MLDPFNEKRRKDMSITDKVQLNRRVIICVNDIILKGSAQDSELEREDKINTFIDRGVRAIFESYRYLNLYICKILPSKMNDIVVILFIGYLISIFCFSFSYLMCHILPRVMSMRIK